MKITVATFVFGDVPYFGYTEAINRSYCDRHGHGFHILRPPEKIRRCPVWYKVSGVKNLLAGSDFVLFIDADAFFLDCTKSLQSLIDEHMRGAALLFGTDRQDKNFAWSDSDANTGVFLVRNCQHAVEVLEEWWNVPAVYDDRWLWTWPPEQGAFNAHVRLGRYADQIKVINYKYMNGNDGSFIRHLSGFSDEERLVLLRAESEKLAAIPQKSVQR
jgi:hypothetical protein